MYAYWYDDGQLMSYVGTKADFSVDLDSHTFYIYETYETLPCEWFRTEVVNGIFQVFNIFAEDVPSDIRAMHLLLVKE